VENKVIVFDGATGTSIQKFDLSEDDYQGHAGCNDYLTISRPDVIEKIHSSYFEAGADAVETNTFGANKIVLADYKLGDRVYELNKKSTELARKIAEKYSTDNQPRFVSGSIGPGTRLASLGQIDFDFLKDAFYTQAMGMIDGGVDLFQIETCQDMLQIKAAIQGVEKAQKEKGTDRPVIVQVTLEENQKMLLGSGIEAVVATFSSFNLFAMGLNCATGPEKMTDAVKYLSRHSPFKISVLPNAGLPKFIGGEHRYELTPKDFAGRLKNFIEEFGVNIVGGCCGTTPEHIKALVEAVGGAPKQRTPELIPAFSSLYSAQPYAAEPKPLIIGERLNATGSKQFRELLLAGDIDGMLAMASEQQAEGAHLADVSMGYAGRDEAVDLPALVEKLNTTLRIPISVDTTNLEALEKALKRIAGKPLINSVNLENGEDRAGKIFQLAKDFGAAVICLTIDENGMAETTERKVQVAERLYKLATEKFGIKPEDLFFDTLIFTLGSGDVKYYNAGVETLEAVKIIKSKFPESNTILGISNVSYGLKPEVRKILNSTCLYCAVQAGLDAAIFHAAKMIPISQINEADLKLFRDLIFNARNEKYDPLKEIITRFEGVKLADESSSKWEEMSLEDKLKAHIVEGRKTGMEETISLALNKYQPLEIINGHILGAMKEVGELFGSGKMQFPFVLQAAEAAKKAVSILEPNMEKGEIGQRGSLMLATVKGDVHDIGKNLVDIIVSNNGFKVFNIGIDQSVDNIIAAYEKHKPDAIGLSGLLVKSTLVMKDALEALNEKGISAPVICGGAALTKEYVDDVLAKVYRGKVGYARDAFDAVKFLSQNEASAEVHKPKQAPTAPKFSESDKDGQEISFNFLPPAPPFWGRKVLTNIDIEEALPYVNKDLLFAFKWQLKNQKTSPAEFARLVEEVAEPAYQKIIERIRKNNLLNPKAIYGYFPCYGAGNDLLILDPGDRDREAARFNFPQQKKPPYLSLARFFRSTKNEPDIVGFQIVTAGERAGEESRRLFANADYRDYLFWQGFATQFADALAEYTHHRLRVELGLAGGESKEPRDIFAAKYQGKRYSFGYNVCPNLEDQAKIFTLLKPEEIGIKLSESDQLIPEESTSAIVAFHPEARYFLV